MPTDATRYTEKQVAFAIRARAISAGSLRKLAKRWKLSAAYLSDVTRGNRPPGPVVLRKLGLKRVPPTPQRRFYVRAD